MTPLTSLVGTLVLFTLVGFLFLFLTLVAGRFLRPSQPNPEKEATYECGEPTIGSSWIQFDLRFYVVALLFVIFDVEVAFFFPWAAVFGKATKLADSAAAQTPQLQQALTAELASDPSGGAGVLSPEAARTLVRLAFVDIFIFFAVLLVGFAYLWKRGDLNWVRATADETGEPSRTWAEPSEPEAAVASATP